MVLSWAAAQNEFRVLGLSYSLRLMPLAQGLLILSQNERLYDFHTSSWICVFAFVLFSEAPLYAVSPLQAKNLWFLTEVHQLARSP